MVENIIRGTPSTSRVVEGGRKKQMLLRSFSNAGAGFSSSCVVWQWRYSSMALPSLPFMPCRRRGPSAPFSSYTSEMSIDPSQNPPSKQGPLKPGLYLVGTPIGNLEDITLRALRVLRSAHVILSEETRHSGKLLQHYSINSPLLSYHKFNESQREQLVLNRLRNGEIVALISDAGTPGISDPGTELAMSCSSKGIPVIPIPGPCALVTALSASGLPTNEFTFGKVTIYSVRTASNIDDNVSDMFEMQVLCLVYVHAVGFLPKHAGSRKKRLMISATEAATQIFYVPPHKLSQFLEEIYYIFGASRRCVMAREMTKLHEQFWRGSVGEAKEAFSTYQPKGEITFIVEGKAVCVEETPTESQLETDLGEMISKGYSLSEAVKLVAAGTSASKKAIYSIALRKFGKQVESEDE